MRNFWIGLALMLAVAVHAAEDVQVKVTGDRVSLRAAPELNSILLDRAMEGDRLVLVDDSNAEWFGVVPPDRVDLWVNGEFVQDGNVIPDRLNVRSGPSLNHSVVGVVEQDQELTIRGEAGGWLRIAPPMGTVVWISRQYAEIEGAEKKPIVEIKVESAPPAEIDAVMSSAAGNADLPETLIPDSGKTQGARITRSGILKPAGSLLYQLIEVDSDDVLVCYVRGNTQQMNKLDGQKLRIIGRAYWAVGLDRPVIVPVKIRPLK